MICPVCGSERISVRETAHGPNGEVYRRRRCIVCGTKFRTIETAIEDADKVNKDYTKAMINKSDLLRTYYKNKNA